MVKQYPYTLYVVKAASGSTDGNGNWIPGTSSETAHSKCRDEANAAGRMVSNGNGISVAFDNLIQAPRGTEPLDPGTKVVVKDAAGTVRATGVVIRSRKDQLHTRIWV